MIKLKNILLEKKELDSKHVKQLAIYTDQNHHTLARHYLSTLMKNKKLAKFYNAMGDLNDVFNGYPPAASKLNQMMEKELYRQLNRTYSNYEEIYKALQEGEMATTNKEIIEKLECVESKLMGGELEQIHQVVKEIKEILLDPEDGLIVRVNKNTYWRKQINVQEIEELKSFKKNVTHALWAIYTIVLGVITKLIFWK